MATKTIGATGRDYATLALWAAYVNALALSAAEIGQCFNDSEFSTVAKITIGGYTGSSGTNTVTLTCGTGQSFRDNANKLTNALRYNQSNGVGLTAAVAYDKVLNVTGNNFILDGLQLKQTSSNGNELFFNFTGGTANVTVQNCIFQGLLKDNNHAMVQVWGGDLTNCVIIVTSATSGGGYNGNSVSGDVPAIADCTVVASNSSTGIGISAQYANGVLAKNCAVAGFTTDYNGTASASSTNNATDKGSFGGTNWGGSGQVSLVGTTEWQSVTSGSEDYRLKSTSAKLKDKGATIGPTNDIIGTARPQGAAYDIGCWELKSVVKTPWPLWQARAA